MFGKEGGIFEEIPNENIVCVINNLIGLFITNVYQTLYGRYTLHKGGLPHPVCDRANLM